MSVTIRDVAARAEVSLATASRALRDLPVIAESTRRRVQEAAADLGYVLPTRNAPAVPEPRRPRVVLFVPYIGRWYFARLLEGLERVLHTRGIDLIVARPVDVQGRRRSVAEHVQDLGVNGVVLADVTVDDIELQVLAERGIPVVLIGVNDLSIDTVGIDDRNAGFVMARHLLTLGHRRIGLLTEGKHEWGFLSARDRREGFLAALAEEGVEWDPALEVHADFTVTGAKRAVETLFELADPPSAVIAHSDEMAFGVIAAARAHGLRVPEDVSVIGIDGHDMAEAWELTTLAQPVDTLGELAAWQMASRIEGSTDDAPRHLRLPTTLVVRASTACIA